MQRIDGEPQAIPSTIETLKEPKRVAQQFNKMFAKNISCET